MMAKKAEHGIRLATADDVGEILRLIRAIADYHEQSHYVLTSDEELLAAGFSEPGKFSALVAEAGGQIIGFVSYTVNYSIWLGCDYMYIDDLFVDEGYRGDSVGEALMRAAKAHCQRIGLSRMKWEVNPGNVRARQFYERLGTEYYEKGVFVWDWSAYAPLDAQSPPN